MTDEVIFTPFKLEDEDEEDSVEDERHGTGHVGLDSLD
jgi:hypothetical protein